MYSTLQTINRLTVEANIRDTESLTPEEKQYLLWLVRDMEGHPRFVHQIASMESVVYFFIGLIIRRDIPTLSETIADKMKAKRQGTPPAWINDPTQAERVDRCKTLSSFWSNQIMTDSITGRKGHHKMMLLKIVNS